MNDPENEGVCNAMVPTGTFCEKSDEIGRPLGKDGCKHSRGRKTIPRC